MSSQRYMPRHLVVRSEAPCKAPAQRRRAAILTGAVKVSQGVDYWARKSALAQVSHIRWFFG